MGLRRVLRRGGGGGARRSYGMGAVKMRSTKMVVPAWSPIIKSLPIYIATIFFSKHFFLGSFYYGINVLISLFTS